MKSTSATAMRTEEGNTANDKRNTVDGNVERGSGPGYSIAPLSPPEPPLRHAALILA